MHWSQMLVKNHFLQSLIKTFNPANGIFFGFLKYQVVGLSFNLYMVECQSNEPKWYEPNLMSQTTWVFCPSKLHR